MWEEGGGHRGGWGIDTMPDPLLQTLDDAAGLAGLLISPADERVLEEMRSSYQTQMHQVQRFVSLSLAPSLSTGCGSCSAA